MAKKIYYFRKKGQKMDYLVCDIETAILPKNWNASFNKLDNDKWQNFSFH